MNQRKDMGDIPASEVVAPQRTGRTAVVVMQVEVMVEVPETDDWGDMTEAAKDQLARRIVDAKGFFPYYAKARTIYTNTSTDYFRSRTYVEGKGQW